MDIGYGYSNYGEQNVGIVISTAKKNREGIAIASKVFLSARDFLGEFLIMDVIFLQEFLSISHDETKRWLKPRKKINTSKKSCKNFCGHFRNDR